MGTKDLRMMGGIMISIQRQVKQIDDSIEKLRACFKRSILRAGSCASIDGTEMHLNQAQLMKKEINVLVAVLESISRLAELEAISTAINDPHSVISQFTQSLQGFTITSASIDISEPPEISIYDPGYNIGSVFVDGRVKEIYIKAELNA